MSLIYYRRAIFLKNILLILLAHLPLVSAAQKTQVYGTIRNSANGTLENATIIILKGQDSTVVMSLRSDSVGKYEANNLGEGTFILNISCIGYQGKYLTLTLSGTRSKQQDFQLLPQANLLDEVVISKGRGAITNSAEKITLNIASSINAMGSNAYDLLSKAPGIRVGGDGAALIVNGKNRVSIFLNGNNLYLTENEIPRYLATINCTDIESIEIIDNPSSKFDAGGGAVINIKTRKSNNLGFNTNIAANYSIGSNMPKTDGAARMNFRNKWINSYFDFSYSDIHDVSSMVYDRFQIGPNHSTNSFAQNYKSSSELKGTNFKFGTDINLSAKSAFDLDLDASDNTKTTIGKSVTAISSTANSIDSELISNSLQPLHTKRISYSGNYTFNKSAGSHFNLGINYGTYNISSNSVLPNTYLNNNGDTLSTNTYLNNTGTKISIKSINSDFTAKVLQGNLNTGLKVSIVNSANNLFFYNVINGAPILDNAQSNRFSHKESISAGFFDYAVDCKRISVRLGARVEYTQSKGVLDNQNLIITATDTSYLNVFPNVSFKIKSSNDVSWGFIFSSRVDRPNYRDLNPFVFVIDQLNYNKGNPFLRPQYTSEGKISFAYKQVVASSVSYAVVKDFILFYRDTLGYDSTFKMPLNLANKRIVNWNNSIQLQLEKWWDCAFNFGVSYQQVKGTINSSYLNMHYISWTSSGNMRFSYKNWQSEISGFYNSAYLDAPAVIEPVWSMDLGFRRKVMGGSGSIGVGVSDIFNSFHYRLSRDYGGLKYFNVLRWETRLLKCSFVYEFGRRAVKSVDRKATKIDEELRRIK